MIPVRNIYYMLSYAFRVLHEKGYKNVEIENFDNVSELCAAILVAGMKLQIKRGLFKEYLPHTAELSTLQGKVEVSDTIMKLAKKEKRLVCAYDEFTVNSYMNRIIKTTIELLLKADMPKTRKRELRKVLIFLYDVETLKVDLIDWNFHYNRNNQHYRMLVSVCYLVIKGLLQSKREGTVKLMSFFDDQRMSAIYEKFIYEYYRKEHPEISVSSSRIKWQLDDGYDNMLPNMQTDVMLSNNEKTLIIDAKYYSRNTQVYYGKQTIHSRNLYQIFTYIKNASVNNREREILGMLLYAKTADTKELNEVYNMSGNKIAVKTLDLNVEFKEIAQQLDSIVEAFL